MIYTAQERVGEKLINAGGQLSPYEDLRLEERKVLNILSTLVTPDT